MYDIPSTCSSASVEAEFHQNRSISNPMGPRNAHGPETEQNCKISLRTHLRNLPTHTSLNLRPSDLRWAQATPYSPLKTTVAMLASVRLEDRRSSPPLRALGEAKGVVKMVDWSELPHDLIGKIAQKVEQIEDFVTFSCVCVSWRGNAVKENRLSSGLQLLWVVMSEENPHNPDLRGFYSLYQKRMFSLVLPEAVGAYIVGCSQGWICTRSKDNLQISLLNPLTRTQISLPPPGTFDPPLIRWHTRCQVTRMEAFKDTCGFLVVAAFGPLRALSEHYYQLALFRPGDKAWTPIADGTTVFGDFAILNRHLYVLDLYGTVYTCNLLGLGSPNPLILASAPSDLGRTHIRKSHLVNCLGNLLLVVQLYDNFLNAVMFVAYKLDLKTNNWIKVENFQEYAIFVGIHYSMCLSSPEVDDFRHNNIYFTDFKLSGRRMSVFSMKDKTFTPHCSGVNVLEEFRSPLFFMPNLY